MTERPTEVDAEWLTKGEAAAVLRVSLRTLDRYSTNGSLRPSRTPGGHPRYRRRDIEALLEPRPDRVDVKQ
ncbi:helix-turn-helix domain-containing protein [Cellulomonas triticagri]|uniref:Helix-turn-helix domain-containing protein n=1 Tax=Cellulomonas triticagri TaxID=2483352 RepID=A0A3M2JEK7_9CELL|nr:helix-turn-helix domain-containing protein [Cellulomonas triticagri]RMI09395.1 helix-turn-helix domain-containing protein [Cellulomonas triticagri]